MRASLAARQKLRIHYVTKTARKATAWFGHWVPFSGAARGRLPRGCELRDGSARRANEPYACQGPHQVSPNKSDEPHGWRRRAKGAVVATLGWLLSPLSWWNDLVVNVPLAYLFAVPFSLLDERLYVPAFALGYWLTNVLGFVLLHKGVAGMINRRTATLRHDLLVATAYTILVAVVAWLGWLPSPSSLLEQWRGS